MKMFIVFKNLYFANFKKNYFNEKRYIDYNLLLKNAYNDSNSYIKKNLKDEINPKLKCAVSSILFKYYFNVYERIKLLTYLEKIGKNNIIIAPSIGKYNDGIEEVNYKVKIPLPSRYSNLSFTVRYLILLKNTLFQKNRKSQVKTCDILVLAEHFVHREIWQEIEKHLDINKIGIAKFDDTKWLNRINFSRKNIPNEISEELKLSGKILNYTQNKFLRIELLNYLSLINVTKPKIIISFCEHNEHAGILSYLAELKKIKVINLSHTLSYGFHRADSPFDYYLVFGISSVNYLNEMGGQICGKVIPIGSPRLDKYSHQIKNGKNTKCNDILFLSDSTIALGRELKLRYVKDFLTLVKKFPLYTFLIKKHTSEDDNLWEELGGNLPNIKIYQKDSKLTDLLPSVKLAVNIGWSVSAMDVAAAKVLLINLNYNNIYDFMGLSKFDFAKIVTNYEQLETAFRALIYSETANCQYDFDSFLDYHCSNRGNSAKKIAEFLEEKL